MGSRRTRKWMFFRYRLRPWMQDSAHATGFFGGGAMSLTLHAQGTRATVGDASCVEDPQRSIVFGTPLLWVECCPHGQRSVPSGSGAKSCPPKLPTRAARAHCGEPKDGSADACSDGRGLLLLPFFSGKPELQPEYPRSTNKQQNRYRPIPAKERCLQWHPYQAQDNKNQHAD